MSERKLTDEQIQQTCETMLEWMADAICTSDARERALDILAELDAQPAAAGISVAEMTERDKAVLVGEPSDAEVEEMAIAIHAEMDLHLPRKAYMQGARFVLKRQREAVAHWQEKYRAALQQRDGWREKNELDESIDTASDE